MINLLYNEYSFINMKTLIISCCY